MDSFATAVSANNACGPVRASGSKPLLSPVTRYSALGKLLQFVNEAAGLIGFAARGNGMLAQRCSQFGELLGASQQREIPFARGAINTRWESCLCQ